MHQHAAAAAVGHLMGRIRLPLSVFALTVSLGCDDFRLWGVTGSPYPFRTLSGGSLHDPSPVALTLGAPNGHVNVQFRLLSSEPLPEAGVQAWTQNGYVRLDRGSGGGAPRVRFSLEYFLEPDAGITPEQQMNITDAGTLRVYTKADVVTDAEYPTPPTETWGLLGGCGGKTLCTTTMRFVWAVEDFDGKERYDLVPEAFATCRVPEAYANKAHWQTVIMDDDGGLPNVPGG